MSEEIVLRECHIPIEYARAMKRFGPIPRGFPEVVDSGFAGLCGFKDVCFSKCVAKALMAREYNRNCIGVYEKGTSGLYVIYTSWAIIDVRTGKAWWEK